MFSRFHTRVGRIVGLLPRAAWWIVLGAMAIVWLVSSCADDRSDSTAEVIDRSDSTAEVIDRSDSTAVVIDSDGAFDDLKAILFLLERPDVDILALTMSGTGVAHCPAGAENVSAVLERVGAPDIPVACGRTTPLVGDNEAPTIWRAGADGLGGVELPEPRPLSDLEAPQLLAETISSSEGKVVLVALGPLTNIAEAIEADPSFLDNVDRVYLMGGAVDVGGNVMYANPDAEFNIWADPHAAAILFDTDVPITLIPLDATNAVPVTPYLYEAVAAHRNVSPVSQFVADYLDASPLFGGLYQWDELAAVVTVDASVATFEDRNLAVVEEGGIAAGATIESAQGRSVRVAVKADRQLFEEVFYESIIGTSDPGITDWSPDATVTWDGTSCDYVGPDPLPDRPLVLIQNTSPDLMALLTGRYAPGTTRDDWDVYLASGSADLPPWWSPQDQVIVPPGAQDVWVLDGGPHVTAVCVADSTRLWELAGPSLAESATQTAAPVERIQAKVVFDGETCAYDGPSELGDGAAARFEFETTETEVAMIVVGVYEGTTWDEVAEYVVDHPASMVPPFVDYRRIEVQTGAGTMVMTMPSGSYLVTCNTAYDHTDTAHPAALIEVADG